MIEMLIMVLVAVMAGYVGAELHARYGGYRSIHRVTAGVFMDDGEAEDDFFPLDPEDEKEQEKKQARGFFG